MNGYIHESATKDDEERSIPVPAFILEQLAIHIEDKCEADHAFASSQSGVVLRNCTFYGGWFNDAAAEISLPGLTPHKLRHRRELAVSAGANVKAL